MPRGGKPRHETEVGGMSNSFFSDTQFRQSEISEAAIDRHLAANSVSSLYATSRSYLEFMTSMTPIKRFVLPAIDPYKVVDES